jgi:hypothetical protein
MKAVTSFFHGREKSEIVAIIVGIVLISLASWWATLVLPHRALKVIAGTANFGGLFFAGNYLVSTVLNTFSFSGRADKPFSWFDSREDLITFSCSLLAFVLLAWWSTNFLPRSVVYGIAGLAICAALVAIAYTGARLLKERFANEGDHIFR